MLGGQGHRRLSRRVAGATRVGSFFLSESHHRPLSPPPSVCRECLAAVLCAHEYRYPSESVRVRFSPSESVRVRPSRGYRGRGAHDGATTSRPVRDGERLRENPSSSFARMGLELLGPFWHGRFQLSSYQILSNRPLLVYHHDWVEPVRIRCAWACGASRVGRKRMAPS